jgi:hypothetical protein
VASPDAIDSMMPPGDATAPPGDATAPPDDATAPPGDAAPMCNATAPFGSPAPVMFLATTGLSVLRTPRLSANELTLYLDGGVGTNPVNLYVAHRNSVTDPFDMPKRVEAAYSAAGDGNASLSANEMNLWLASRPTTGEGYHLYVATRTSALVEAAARRSGSSRRRVACRCRSRHPNPNPSPSRRSTGRRSVHRSGGRVAAQPLVWCWSCWSASPAGS